MAVDSWSKVVDCINLDLCLFLYFSLSNYLSRSSDDGIDGTEARCWGSERSDTSEVHSHREREVRSSHLGSALLLPSFRSADPTENEIMESLKKQGITLFKGDLYNHSRLVQEIHAVDVAIWAVGRYQTRIIAAIKEGGNIIKRFILLGIPNDVDMPHALQPAEMKLQRCREMRQFIEQSGVP
ncbi:isoflavone reductase-like protein [Carex rostrata]